MRLIIAVLAKLWPAAAGPGSDRVRADVLWSVGGYLLMGFSLFFGEFLIGRLHGPAGLGQFMQVMAGLMLVSHFAVIGIPVSVVVRVAGNQARGGDPAPIILGGLMGAAGLGLSLTLLGWVLPLPWKPPGLLAALPFMCLNRVGFASLIGSRRYPEFATLQVIRHLMLAPFVVFFPDPLFPYCLAMAEAASMVLLGWRLRGALMAPLGEGWHWLRNHLPFGLRSLIDDPMSELVPRLHLSILAVFAPAEICGIFGFAAFFADALAQLAVVFRNLTTPALASGLSGGDRKMLALNLAGQQRLTYLLALVAVTPIIGLFPVMIWVLGLDPRFLEGWPALAVILVGLGLAYGYLPLVGAPFAAGRPGFGLAISLGVLATSLTLDYTLIPVFGLMGAAIAASVAYLTAAVASHLVVTRLLGIPATLPLALYRGE